MTQKNKLLTLSFFNSFLNALTFLQIIHNCLLDSLKVLSCVINVVKYNTFEVKIMTTTVSLRLPEDLN